MPRGKQGMKSNRKERNADFQSKLKERKRIRTARAAEHVQNKPMSTFATDAVNGAAAKRARQQQIETLEKETMKELKRRCTAQNLPVRSRDTKMSMILLLMGEHPRQVGAELVDPS